MAKKKASSASATKAKGPSARKLGAGKSSRIAKLQRDYSADIGDIVDYSLNESFIAITQELSEKKATTLAKTIEAETAQIRDEMVAAAAEQLDEVSETISVFYTQLTELYYTSQNASTSDIKREFLPALGEIETELQSKKSGLKPEATKPLLSLAKKIRESMEARVTPIGRVMNKAKTILGSDVTQVALAGAASASPLIALAMFAFNARQRKKRQEEVTQSLRQRRMERKEKTPSQTQKTTGAANTDDTSSSDTASSDTDDSALSDTSDIAEPDDTSLKTATPAQTLTPLAATTDDANSTGLLDATGAPIQPTASRVPPVLFDATGQPLNSDVTTAPKTTTLLDASGAPLRSTLAPPTIAASDITPAPAAPAVAVEEKPKSARRPARTESATATKPVTSNVGASGITEMLTVLSSHTGLLQSLVRISEEQLAFFQGRKPASKTVSSKTPAPKETPVARKTVDAADSTPSTHVDTPLSPVTEIPSATSAQDNPITTPPSAVILPATEQNLVPPASTAAPTLYDNTGYPMRPWTQPAAAEESPTASQLISPETNLPVNISPVSSETTLLSPFPFVTKESITTPGTPGTPGTPSKETVINESTSQTTASLIPTASRLISPETNLPVNISPVSSETNLLSPGSFVTKESITTPGTPGKETVINESTSQTTASLIPAASPSETSASLVPASSLSETVASPLITQPNTQSRTAPTIILPSTQASGAAPSSVSSNQRPVTAQSTPQTSTRLITEEISTQSNARVFPNERTARRDVQLITGAPVARPDVQLITGEPVARPDIQLITGEPVPQPDAKIYSPTFMSGTSVVPDVISKTSASSLSNIVNNSSSFSSTPETVIPQNLPLVMPESTDKAIVASAPKGVESNEPLTVSAPSGDAPDSDTDAPPSEDTSSVFIDILTVVSSHTGLLQRLVKLNEEQLEFNQRTAEKTAQAEEEQTFETADRLSPKKDSDKEDSDDEDDDKKGFNPLNLLPKRLRNLAGGGRGGLLGRVAGGALRGGGRGLLGRVAGGALSGGGGMLMRGAMMVPSLLGMGSTAAAAGGAAAGGAAATGGLMAGLTALGSTLAAVAAPLTGIAAALYVAYKVFQKVDFSKVLEPLTKLFNKLIPIIKTVGEMLFKAFMIPIKIIMAVLSKLASFIAAVLQPVFDGLGMVLSPVVEGFTWLVDNVLGPLTTSMLGLLTSIENFIDWFAEASPSDIFQGISEFIGNGFQRIFDQVYNAIADSTLGSWLGMEKREVTELKTPAWNKEKKSRDQAPPAPSSETDTGATGPSPTAVPMSAPASSASPAPSAPPPAASQPPPSASPTGAAPLLPTRQNATRAPRTSMFGGGRSGGAGGGASFGGATPTPKSDTSGASFSGTLDDTKKMIIEHEGIRYRPYKDSLGLWTVGVGHLIGNGRSLPPEMNREFSHPEVMEMFEQDYEHHARAASQIPGFNKMNTTGKAALTDLTFNMGPGWYKKWPTTTKALATGNAEQAAAGLENSKWYDQVGRRAPRIVSMIRGGVSSPDSSTSTDATSAAPTPALPFTEETTTPQSAPTTPTPETGGIAGSIGRALGGRLGNWIAGGTSSESAGVSSPTPTAPTPPTTPSGDVSQTNRQALTPSLVAPSTPAQGGAAPMIINAPSNVNNAMGGGGSSGPQRLPAPIDNEPVIRRLLHAT